MVQNCSDEAAVPEEGLWREIVDAVRAAQLDIRNGLVEREVGGEK